MDRRLELHNILLGLCPNVYFQPPSSTKMAYPCIVYSLAHIDSRYANNLPYTLSPRYSVTYITRNPDDDVHYKLASLPTSRFDRAYSADNLYHYTFDIYH